MKDTYLAEQDNCNATTLSLADLRPELAEECFDVLPLDVCTRRVSKYDFERALVPPLYVRNGTTNRYQLRRECFLTANAQGEPPPAFGGRLQRLVGPLA